MKKKLSIYFCGTGIVFLWSDFRDRVIRSVQELRQELIKRLRDDLGPNSERCRE
jgi:hypothetical protein